VFAAFDYYVILPILPSFSNGGALANNLIDFIWLKEISLVCSLAERTNLVWPWMISGHSRPWSEATRPKGRGYPGKVLSFHIVPLDPALKGGAYGVLAGQGTL
jgi:hypothetical protein